MELGVQPGVKMEEQNPSAPELEKGGGKGPCVIDLAYVAECPGSTASKEAKPEQFMGRQHHNWGAPWQEILKAQDSSFAELGNPQMTQLWDNPKAFLASFEQVAKACQWPMEEWVARLLPALSGEAEEAFRLLEGRDREDYGKVKAAILQGDAIKMEMRRQHFRNYRYQEVEDPRRVYSHLQELCRQWLKPETHTKEEILELLILEQFLAIWPSEIQSSVPECGPESCIQTVVLTDDFLIGYQETETGQRQVPFQETAADSREAEVASSDSVQRDPDAEAAEKDDGSNGLTTAGGITDPTHSSLVLVPSEGQEVADPGPSEAFEGTENLKGETLPLNKTEWTMQNLSKVTMCWEVTETNYGHEDSLEGVLIPKCGITSLQPMEMIFTQSNESKEPFLGGSISGEKEPYMNKEKNYQQGRNTSPEVSPRNVSVEVEIHGEESESESQWKKKPKKKQNDSVDSASHLAFEETSTRPPTILSSKGRRMYRITSGVHADRLVCISTTYECPVCRKDFRQRDHLERHQRIHTGVKPYHCPDCKKAFSRKDTLIQHQRIHTGGKPYECCECGKTFSFNGALRRHQRSHSGKKPPESFECRKSFRQKNMMKRHQRIHGGKEPFVCLECGLSFKHSGTLERHKSSHTVERPYKCSQCGRGFVHKKYWLRHEKIHTGEKYGCSECEKSFSRKDTLLRHQRNHTQENL